MENLNAEQVKKALECCENECFDACMDCPSPPNTSGSCTVFVMRQALALINSQEQRIKKLTEENERLRAEVSVKKKLLDEAENRYDETAKRFYKDGVNDMKSEIKKSLLSLCKGDVTDICRMTDQIAKEMLEGE